MLKRTHLRSLRIIAVLLVSILAVAGISGQLNTAQAQQRSTAASTKQAWEYKVVFVDPANWGAARIEPQLNQLGAEGWEVATTGMATGILFYTFKRPK